MKRIRLPYGDLFKKISLLLAILVAFTFQMNGQTQTFSTVGTSVNTGGNCFMLTPADVSKAGAIWGNSRIDLNSNFDIQFSLNFGTNASWTGGDGMAFILQPVSTTQIGVSGSGKGYGNIYDINGNIVTPGVTPSVVVEYDTYDDNGGTNALAGLFFNGDYRRTPANTGVNQTSIGFVNDGQYHSNRVTWNASTHTLTLYFNGVQVYSYQRDFVNEIFSGQSLVYFGFTAGTGGSVNQQSVCYDATNSTFGSVFTPTLGQILDACSGNNNGSATINLQGGTNPFIVALNGVSHVFTQSNITSNTVTFSNLPADVYAVRILESNGHENNDLSFTINDNPAPTITASGSLSLLPDQTVTLTANAANTYLWSNGATTQSIVVGTAQVGVYTVTNNLCTTTSIPTTVSLADVAPDITVPDDITVNNDPGVCGAIVNFTATETTGVPASTITYSQEPGTSFPVGITTVTATATNSVGTSTKTFNVIVTDNEQPVFILTTPGTATVTIPEMQTFVSDCTMIPFNFSDPLPAGSVVTGIDLTYVGVDQGWGGTNGTDDLYLDGTHIASSVYTHTPQTFHTTYTGAIPGYVYGGNNVFGFVFTCYPGWQGFIHGGTITIHYTSSFGPKTVNSDAGSCGATVVLDAPPTSDNCGVETVTNDAPSTFPIGTTNVTWTATDINGNTNTISQDITVVDNQPPVVLTKDITVQVSNGTATITPADIDNGSSDNCGIASYSLDKTSFDCSNIGSNTVTLTVTDIHGNTATATANVIVNGSGSPVTVTASGPTTFCSGGSVTLTASEGDSYLWSNGETTPSIIVSTSGSYTVTVSSSSSICPATSVPTVVTVNPLSTLTITPANPVICSGSSLILNSTITAGIGSPVATPIVSSLSEGGQTSAKLAVGLRKLVSTYNGPAIRLRRSSDNAESDFGFSGNELDLIAINTFLGGSTGYVATLYDQSGNGVNLTNADAAANQPIFVPNGLNGKPNMHMGPNQYLFNTVNYPSPFTVVYAAKQTGPNRGRMLSAVSNNWLLGWWGQLKGVAYFEGWLTQIGGNVSSIGDSNPYVYTGSSDGNNNAFTYQNGTMIGNNAGANAGPNGIVMNRSGIYGEPSDGDFTELYIFNSVLSTADRQLVENSTASYYSIYAPSSTVAGPSLTVSPTTTTPYTINAIDANGCAVSNSINVTVTNIDDQSVTAAPATICETGSSTVTVGASQLGINYTLRNNADNSIVAGPIAGTGSAINFNTGTISATTTYNVLAEKLSAQGSLKFDGNASYVSVPHNNAYNMSSITIEAMVLFNGSYNIGNVIMKGYYGWGIEIRGDGAIEWWNQFAQTSGPNSTPGAVPIGQWTHIAVTVGNGQTKFYVNGVLNSVANEAIINNNTGALYFGTQGECLCNNFDGMIDEIRIWNTVRTQAEIDANKTACLSGTENGLVSLFKFNEGTGTTTEDAMGVSNGVLNNFDSETAWSTSNPDITCASASCSLQLTATPTVTVLPAPTKPLAFTITSANSCELNTGFVAANIDNSSGVAPINITWDDGNGFTSQATSLSNLAAGTYTATVKDFCGTTVVQTVNILQGTTFDQQVEVSGSTTLCPGSTVRLTAAAGANTYAWKNWDGTQWLTVGSNAQFLDVTTAGQYFVEMSDAANCTTGSNGITIYPPNPVVLSITAEGYNSCNAHNNGGAGITSLVGGTTPYTVSWTGPNGFTSSLYFINNLEAGSYTVTAVDACGTTVTANVTVVEPDRQPQIMAVSGSTTLCNPESSVSISAYAGAVSYVWNKVVNGVTSTVSGSTNTFNATEAGTYYVTMTDAYGCAQNSDLVSVYAPNPIPLTATTTLYNPYCNQYQKGAVEFLYSGGTAPITFNGWSDGNNIISTNTFVSNLEPGTYTVSATDACGVTVTKTVTIVTAPAMTIPTITASAPFCGSNSVTLTLSSTPYSFVWYKYDDINNTWVGEFSANQSTVILPPDAGFYYGVSVKDENNCYGYPEGFSTAVPTPITFSVYSNPSCYNNTGNAGIFNLSGGKMPVTYSWTDGGSFNSTNASLSNLAPGTYTVTAIDACANAVSQTVTITGGVTAATITTTTQNVCAGSSAVLSITNYNAAYTYQWLKDGINISGATGASYTANVQGNYNVNVTNGDCNSGSNGIYITVGSPLTVNINSNATSCVNGGGYASAFPVGGVGPFTFLGWTGPNSYTSGSSNINGLAVGTYTASYIDVCGNQASASVTINAATPVILPSITASKPYCIEGESVVLTLGPTSYSFAWVEYDPSNLAQPFIWAFSPNQSSITVTKPGVQYYVVHTDANNCNSFSQGQYFNTNLPTPITFSVSSNPSCGTNTGSANVYNILGGKSPITYAWTDGASFNSTNSFINNIPAGTYTVSLTDACANVVSQAVTITGGIATATITSTATNLCFGTSSQLSITNVTAGLSYQWKLNGVDIPGQTGTTLTATLSGTYQVSASNGTCSSFSSGIFITVQPPQVSPFDFTINSTNSCGTNNGSAFLNRSGGTAPYTFLGWTGSNGYTNNSTSITNLSPGIYTATYKDLCGTTVIKSMVITHPASNTITINEICGAGSTIDTLKAFTNGQAVSYSWSKYDYTQAKYVAVGTLQSLPVTDTGLYSVTIKDTSTCFAGNGLVIINRAAPSNVYNVSISTSDICAGSSAFVSLNGTQKGYWYILYKDGVATSTKTQSSNGLGISFGVSSIGSYTIVASTAATGGCTLAMNGVVQVLTINNPLPVVAAITSSTNNVCVNTSLQMADVTAGGVWLTQSSTLATVSSTGLVIGRSLGTTNIAYRVTDAITGCQNTVTKSINILATPPTPTISASGPTTFCTGDAVTLTANTTGTATGYSWLVADNGALINPLASTQSITVSTGGDYQVRVYDNNGCGILSPVTSLYVTIPRTPTVTADGPTSICPDGSGSVNLTASDISNLSKNSLKFNGSNYVEAPHQSYTGLTTRISVEAWFKTDDASVTQYIVSKGTNDYTPGQYGLVINAGKVEFHLSMGGQHHAVDATTPIQSGKWYHAVGTWDSTLLKIYVNGVEEAQAVFVGPLTANTEPLEIGRLGLSYAPYNFLGEIDEVRIWNIALTQSQINAQKGTIINFSNSMVANYRFEEGTGTTVADGGFGNPATLYGSPTWTPSTAPFYNYTPTYVWSPGEGTNSTFNVNAAGSYTVTVNAGGCTNTSAPITITTSPVATITASGSLSLLPGETVTLTASAGNSYLWSNGATTQSIVVGTAELGTYTVTVTDNNCTTTSLPTTVSSAGVTPVINIPADISVNNEPGTCGAIVNFTATETTGVPTSTIKYSHAPGSLFPIGTTTVTATATNSVGTSIKTFNVTVTDIELPVVTTKNITVQLSNGSATITEADIDNGSTDNCGIASYSLDKTSFNCSNVGTNTVTLTVTDIHGNSASATANVIVSGSGSPATITASGPTTFCSGGSVTLTASAGTSYAWSNGSTSSSITVSNSGDYSVTVTNANGCSSLSNMTTVTVNPSVTATVTADGPTTFCAGSSVTLTSSSLTGNVWSSGETTPSIVVNKSGNYSVIVTNGGGCSATSTPVSVTVNQPAPATITASGPTTFCSGGSITLTSSASAGNNWSTSANTASISVNSTGNYSVTITDANGCVSTSAVTAVTVNPTPVATITASGPTTFCAGGSVTLTSASNSGNSWSTGANSQSIVVTSSGNYTVTVSNGNGCSATSASITVTVNPNPVVTISASGPTDFCPGGLVILTSSISTGNSWSNGSTTASITVAQSNSYSVSNTNASGCSSSSNTISVTASDKIAPVPDVPSLSARTILPGDVIVPPSATDNCTSGKIIATTGDQIDGLAPGTYTINWTYTDNNNNSTSQQQTITVRDNTPPTLKTMPAIVKNNDLGECGAIVTYTLPVAKDNVSTNSISVSEGGGDGMITFDTKLSSNVTGVDFVAANEFQDIIHGHGANLNVNVEVFNPLDNSWTLIKTIQTGIVDYHLGGTSINFPAITQVSKIRFVADRNVGAAFHLYDLAINLNSISLVQTGGLSSGSKFPIGVTINKFDAIDAAGNVASSSFTVTILDRELPVLTGFAGSTHNAAGNCAWNGSASTITISDNCPNPLLLTEQYFDQYGNRFYNGQSTVAQGSIILPNRNFPTGVNTAILTVTDAAGNVSQVATFNITVLDVTAPTIIASGNITQKTDPGVCGAFVSIPVPRVSDNCTIKSVVNSFNGGPGASGRYPTGTTVVTWTVTDMSGNQATTSQTITIVDQELPTIYNIPQNINQTNDAGSCGAMVTWDPVKALDNCGLASFVADHNPGEIFPLGETTVNFTAIDRNGNRKTASFTITVSDNEAPRVITRPVTVTLVNGAASITAAAINNGSYDNCGAVTLSASKTNFTCADVGINKVTLNVTDAFNNTSSAIVLVTVIGEVPTSNIVVTPNSTLYTGGVPTELYLGYGATAVSVADNVTGVTPITYTWTGSTGLSCTNCAVPTFTPTVPGYSTFNVVATNKYGCTTSNTVSICVRDIRVPNGGGKVYVCDKDPKTGASTTITLTTAQVANQLAQNPDDKLGPCGMAACNVAAAASTGSFVSSFGKEDAVETIAGLTAKVSPNPTNHVFRIVVSSPRNTPVQIRLMSEAGKVHESRSNVVLGSTVEMGENLQSGVYFAEVIQGNERVVLKLIKLNR